MTKGGFRMNAYQQAEVEQLRRELGQINGHLGGGSVLDMDVKTVAEMLGRKAAIEHMLGGAAQLPAVPAFPAPAECIPEYRERKALEAQEQLYNERREEQQAAQALRDAIAADPQLRREVERRDRSDSARSYSGNYEDFGPLPGGFDDSLRRGIRDGRL
jgi:hypothetical protein